jgi:hypothetical protein
MIINSVSKAIGKPQFAGQIKGKFQTVLLNQLLLSGAMESGKLIEKYGLIINRKLSIRA